MKKLYIFLIVLIIIILIVVFAYIFLKPRNQVPSPDVAEDTVLHHFTFNRSSRNDMQVNDKGNKHYLYFSKDKVIIKKYGYDFDKEIDLEIPITKEEFRVLEQDIIKWVDKYSFNELALQELQSDEPHPDSFLLDEQRLFKIEVCYSNFERPIINIKPERYEEMLSDLEIIFEKYNSKDTHNFN